MTGSSLPPDWSVVIQRLGVAAAELGKLTFYVEVLEALRAFVPCDAAQVMYFSRNVAPRYLHAINTSALGQELYKSTFYRFDPFYKHMFLAPAGGVTQLRRLEPKIERLEEYFSVFYQDTGMQDEAAVLLPTLGGAVIGIFLQAARLFSKSDIGFMERLFPLIDGLHRAQDRLVIAAARGGVESLIDRFIIVLDEDNNELHRSRELARADALEPGFDDAVQALVRLPNGTSRQLSGGTLNIERLDETFTPSPNGRICIYEPGPRRGSPQDLGAATDAFLRRYPLTARETDVLRLVLLGYPSSKIAAKLSMTVGTVRNHRKQIHDKMDITTEREVFSTFLQFLTSSAGFAQSISEPQALNAR